MASPLVHFDPFKIKKVLQQHTKDNKPLLGSTSAFGIASKELERNSVTLKYIKTHSNTKIIAWQTIK